MTLDVDIIYANTNNDEGLAAVAEAFTKTTHKDLNFNLRTDKEIMELLKLSLENNNSILTMTYISPNSMHSDRQKYTKLCKYFMPKRST